MTETIPTACSGHRVLLTGAAGFLGKVVLEELIRRQDEFPVASIHLLIRPRTGRKAATAQDRFDNEIVASECCAQLPPGWSDNIQVISGDLVQDQLGLDESTWHDLTNQVTHIINCAASVEFNDPLPVAAEANVTSSLNLLGFAQACANLQSMVHVSTAYVAPCPGPDIAINEDPVKLGFDAAQTYKDILAGEADTDQLLASTKLPNTYTFTKALAEALMVERKGDVPLTIVRPSIISATWKHPFPGWIDSHAAFAGFVALCGAGYLRAMVAKGETSLDIVPCDAVVDRILASSFWPGASDGDSAQQDRPLIQHAVTGLDLASGAELCANVVVNYFRRFPVGRLAGLRYVGPDAFPFRVRHFQFHTLPTAVAGAWSSLTGNSRGKRAAARLQSRLTFLNEGFQYFTYNTFRFATMAPLDLVGFDPKHYLETVSRGVRRHLLGKDEHEVALTGTDAVKRTSDLYWAFTQPNGNVAERICAYTLSKGLPKCVDQVTFDRLSFESALDDVDPDGLVAIVPTHRSYMDFVLCSYLFFSQPDLNIALPQIAAAREFAHIPVLGQIFTSANAFFVDRGQGQPDPELSAKIQALATRRQTLEFFIEGTRSRSRQFLAPKRGLLRALAASGIETTILPIALSYDHVPEESAFLRELLGNPKPDMQLLPLLRWTSSLLRNQVELGRIHIACGQPQALDTNTDISQLSHNIMGQLQAQTVTTTHHLESFLAKNPIDGVDVAWLGQEIINRGGRVVDSPLEIRHGLDPVVERGMRYHWIHWFYPEARALYPNHPAIDSHIAENAYFDATRASVEAPQDPRMIALLRTVFDPICQDYARVASVLAASEEYPVIRSAKEVVSAHPDAFLPEVEGVLKDLMAREILTQHSDGSRLVLTGETPDLHDYRAACLAHESEPLTQTA